MTKPMTPKQRKALAFIATLQDGKISGHDLKRSGYGNTGTLIQLAANGYVQAIGLEHILSPNVGRWRITEKGKRAVKMGNAA